MDEVGIEKVSFFPITTDARIPKRHSDGAAGYDLYAISGGVVEPSSCVMFRTGFMLEIPKGLFGIVLGRSGLAVHNGISVRASYVKNGEEVCVFLYNSSKAPFSVERGMRIAQLVFLRNVDPLGDSL